MEFRSLVKYLTEGKAITNIDPCSSTSLFPNLIILYLLTKYNIQSKKIVFINS